MINEKKIIAIIPARGGSKGLPRKNIKQLNGKPLIQWTIESALNTKEIDTVLVTTDCPEIRKIALNCGAESPFLRPAELASDTSTSFDVVKHAIDFYLEEYGENFDILILLEPTSPLREPKDISNMLECLSNNFDTKDGIISLGEVSEHPSIVKTISDDNVVSYVNDEPIVTRRQDFKKAYFPYGVAYIVKTQSFLNEKTFYVTRTLPYMIKRYQCYEIDDIYDFLAIENIMRFQWDWK